MDTDINLQRFHFFLLSILVLSSFILFLLSSLSLLPSAKRNKKTKGLRAKDASTSNGRKKKEKKRKRRKWWEFHSFFSHSFPFPSHFLSQRIPNLVNRFFGTLLLLFLSPFFFSFLFFPASSRLSLYQEWELKHISFLLRGKKREYRKKEDKKEKKEKKKGGQKNEVRNEEWQRSLLILLIQHSICLSFSFFLFLSSSSCLSSLFLFSLLLFSLFLSLSVVCFSSYFKRNALIFISFSPIKLYFSSFSSFYSSLFRERERRGKKRKESPVLFTSFRSLEHLKHVTKCSEMEKII